MSKGDCLAAERGTYILVGHCHDVVQVQVGKRGILQLASGWYLYVGSAFGPGGLAARVSRHLSLDKKPRWHIDYVRPHIQITSVWVNQGGQRLEHDWAKYFLQQKVFAVPMQGFGASDCRCKSHFFSSTLRPDWNAFRDYFAGHRYRCCSI